MQFIRAGGAIFPSLLFSFCGSANGSFAFDPLVWIYPYFACRSFSDGKQEFRLDLQRKTPARLAVQMDQLKLSLVISPVNVCLPG
jgi:hypothetical protein